MLNTIMEFKDSIIKKFGPILGYAIIIVGILAVISIVGFLLKSLVSLAIFVAVTGLILFGIYKLTEVFKSNKNNRP